MAEWYENIYKTFIIASVISFLIFFNTTSQTSLGALISAFVLLIIGILVILLILINKYLSNTNNNNQSFFKSLITILLTFGPFFLLFGIIGFILYMIIYYKNIIISGNISDGYNTFMVIAILLILLQIFLINQNIKSTEFQKNGKLQKPLPEGLILINLFVIMCSYIIHTILKHYTTDG